MAEIPKNNKTVYRGEAAVNKQIDLENKISETSTLTFSDLPDLVLGEIFGKLDLVSRLKTRKVSRYLRNIIDRYAQCEEIKIYTERNQISIHFDRNVTRYKKNDDGKCLMDYQRFGMESKEKSINGKFAEIALNDLEMLKNSKIYLKQLTLTFGENSKSVDNKILKFFKSINTPIRVKSLEIQDLGAVNFLSILSKLSPGTLKDIYFGSLNNKNLKKLAKMDQWKLAKTCYIGGMTDNFKEFLHFNRFYISIETFSKQDVIFIRDALSKSVNFEYCHLGSSSDDRFNIDDVGEALGKALGVRHVQRVDGSNPRVTFRSPIPESNEFLDFEICSLAITIKKIR